MIISHSHEARPALSSPKVSTLLSAISEAQLREWVEQISVPRHFMAEPQQNRATGDWLAGLFAGMGYRVERQGRFSNIVALPQAGITEAIVVGAHYDSVPMCPGADDNGSAVAAMLGCALACREWAAELPVVFVGFNREEDGLLGSQDFVQSYLPTAPFQVRCAHILEMVGYASSEPNSQSIPTGLPISISNTGDFLGLLANGISTTVMKLILGQARAYLPELPVTGLNVVLGMEKFFPVLARSDHAPFWSEKIPAVMWTDTSEFRNHNYHHATDTPDTLNYRFLRQVTQVLTATVIEQGGELRRLKSGKRESGNGEKAGRILPQRTQRTQREAR